MTPSKLALYLVMKMVKTRCKTYNEYVWESFENQTNVKRNQMKGGERDVKLNRIKKKLWCGRSKLPS